MRPEAVYEMIGLPVLGRTIQVPAASLKMWLDVFDANPLVHAGPIGTVWISGKGKTKVDETLIFVSVSVDYHLVSGQSTTQTPFTVMRRIDRAIRNAQQAVNVCSEYAP